MPRLDLDTARMATALNDVSCFRVWCIGVDYNRVNSPGKQWLDGAFLSECVQRIITKYSRAYFVRLLMEGDGTYWNVDPNSGRVWFYGAVKVNALLTKRALDAGLPHVVRTHAPGSKPHDIDLSGSIADFEARVYAAWIDGQTIANETQEGLWNRTRPALYAWRKRAGIQAEANYAQTDNKEDRRIPAAGTYPVKVAVNGRTALGIGWRKANTYHNPARVRQYGHRGQGRKIRDAVNAVLAEHAPTLEQCAESLPAQRSQYWYEPAALKRSLRAHARNDWHSDYLYLGQTRNGKSKWELMQPGQHTPGTSMVDYA